MKSFLPYGQQSVTDDDIAEVVSVLKSARLTQGPTVEAFERSLAERLDVKHAVVCNSGTAALHLAAKAAGIKRGDLVIVPSITFLATANAVRMVGAEVIFSDVDPDSGVATLTNFEEAFDRLPDCDQNRVKAVMPVHLGGQPCRPAELSRYADKRGLAVIEDACHAIGSVYIDDYGNSCPVGACHHSLAAAFSFHPVKTITMGEGGAVTTNDRAFAAYCTKFRNHGITRDPTQFTQLSSALCESGEPNSWYYEMHEIGHNYRATDIQCALGVSQLRRLDNTIARRRNLIAHYRERLSKLGPLIKPVSADEPDTSCWHLCIALIDFKALDLERADVMQSLLNHGIGTQVHYIPVHQQPYYQNRYGKKNLPGASSYYERCLSLPLSPLMTIEDTDRVVDKLSDVLGLG